MLRSLKVQQFKSIYFADLKFGRANLFIGPNGAGKSNILEAFGILAGALSRGLDASNLDDRGIRLSVPTLFKSSFKKTRLPSTFRLEARFENGRYECSIRAGLRKPSLEFHSEALYDGDVKVFGRGPNGISLNHNLVPETTLRVEYLDATRGLWDILSPLASISDGLRAELEQFADFSIYSPQTAIMRGVAIDPRVKLPLGLTGAGLAQAFNEVNLLRFSDQEKAESINKILKIIWEPGWADTVRVGAFNPEMVPSHIKSSGQLLYIRDKFMQTNRNFLGAFDASEGTLYLIFIATLLTHPDAPKSLALDNVDGTLNPRLVKQLADAIVGVCCGDLARHAAESRQAFVTSHHPSALDSFDLFSDDQAVFVAHRDIHASIALGSTKYDRLLPPSNLSKEAWYDRMGGRNLSNMLLDGIIPDAL